MSSLSPSPSLASPSASEPFSSSLRASAPAFTPTSFSSPTPSRAGETQFAPPPPSHPTYDHRDPPFAAGRDWVAPEVVCCRDADEADELLRGVEPGPIGFDLEWKPQYLKGAPQNPIALVQIAEKRRVLLLQVSAMERFPAELKRALESDTYLKVGVAVGEDAKKLNRDFPSVSPAYCLELTHLARAADVHPSIAGRRKQLVSLARLTERYLARALVKLGWKESVRLSDWEGVLDHKQVDYAANDAFAALQLFHHLHALLQRSTPAAAPPDLNPFLTGPPRPNPSRPSPQAASAPQVSSNPV